MKDLKYLFAYTVPVSVYISFVFNGIWTFSAVYYVFLILPILDILTGETSRNLSSEEAASKKTKWIFDLMLYLNVPIVFGLLFLMLQKFKVRAMKFMNMLAWSCLEEFYLQQME